MTPSNKPGADQVTDDSDEQRTSVIDKSTLIKATAEEKAATTGSNGATKGASVSRKGTPEGAGPTGATEPEEAAKSGDTKSADTAGQADDAGQAPVGGDAGETSTGSDGARSGAVDAADEVDGPDEFETVIVRLDQTPTGADADAGSVDDVEPVEEMVTTKIDEDEFEAAGGGLPPWSRVAAAPSEEADREDGTGGQPLVETKDGAIYATDKFDREDPALRRSAIANAAMAGAAKVGRTSVTLGESEKPANGRSSPQGVRRSPRGPRRASLQIKRVDPWSVLKLALVLSVVLFFVWLVAVGVLYIVLDGMGTWNGLNGAYGDLVRPEDQGGGEELISAGRVFGAAALVGAVNIILFTALATVGAFVYNIAADLVGGVEVTLSERE